MDYVKPSPLGISKEQVSKFAEDVAAHLKYQAGEDMWSFVSRWGGQIFYGNEIRPGTKEPESMLVQADGSFRIFLSTVTTPERNRFTIAHELGHLFLHFPKIKKETPGASMVATRYVDPKDSQQQRAEWEANWFAAAFLMPEADFKKQYNTPDKASVARHFGVSQNAVSVRAETLGV